MTVRPVAVGTHGSVAVSTSAIGVVSARSGRVAVQLRNVDATNSVHIGLDSGVTTSTGYELKAGDELKLEQYTGPVYAIAGTSGTVRYLDFG